MGVKYVKKKYLVTVERIMREYATVSVMANDIHDAQDAAVEAMNAALKVSSHVAYEAYAAAGVIDVSYTGIKTMLEV